MADELWRHGASELATMIRERQVRAREVLEAHLSRIEQVNPKLNAVTVVLGDEAMAAAEVADRAVEAGEPLGALHGVPLSVKENIDLAGSATTQGLVAMAEAIPPLDAPHIAQLRAAGAIPFARTNLPDFGLRWHTDNALRGATKNPWDARVTPGGSSGGEAVALATGMTPLGVGNDYGGSLRWPSQCNGTAALKPTLGRVPAGSAVAPEDLPITLQLFAVEGPMARSVRDLRLGFTHMTAPDPRDPWYTPAPLQGPPVPKRVAVCADPGGTGVAPGVAAGVQKAAEALRDAGYETVEVDLPLITEARDLWARVVLTEVNAALLPLLGDVAGADALRFLSLGMEAVPPGDFGTYVSAFVERQGIARAWAQFHAEYPLVLGPVSTAQPFEVGYDLTTAEAVTAIVNNLRLVLAGNLLGLPVAVVPVGESDGLPQGVQVIGGRYREDLCLDAAEAIEERVGVITPIDPR
ncbi:MAG: amidase [Dehalococcoidia bacterium]|nr:amidase [Dehalococcoidia bacterium]